jgi:hypothetical protein
MTGAVYVCADQLSEVTIGTSGVRIASPVQATHNREIAPFTLCRDSLTRTGEWAILKALRSPASARLLASCKSMPWAFRRPVVRGSAVSLRTNTIQFVDRCRLRIQVYLWLCVHFSREEPQGRIGYRLSLLFRWLLRLSPYRGCRQYEIEWKRVQEDVDLHAELA